MSTTTKTPDLDDYDIEAMMAELDVQTAEMIGSAPTPKVEDTTVVEEPIINPKTLDDAREEKAAIVVEPNEDELALASAIQAHVADDEPFKVPTVSKADRLNAEQELDLDEVFGDIVADLESVEKVQIDPVINIEVQPDVAVEDNFTSVEKLEAVEVEDLPELVLEDKTIPEFVPSPASKPERSEKAIEELTKMKYQPDIDAFNRETAFTDATLDVAMTSQASLVARQNEKSARATAQAARYKLKFDSVEALLYESYRKAFNDAGEKVTEKAIENAVRKDSRWRKAKEEVIEAEMFADIQKGLVFALKDRNDMLIQRGSYRRQEMQGQMRLMADLPQTPSPRNLTDTAGHSAAIAAMQKSQK